MTFVGKGFRGGVEANPGGHGAPRRGRRGKGEQAMCYCKVPTVRACKARRDRVGSDLMAEVPYRPA